jgi:hypothetical protein
LRGDNGQDVANFPLKTDGRILSAITLVNLHSGDVTVTSDGHDDDTMTAADRYEMIKKAKFAAEHGLHLIFPSFDGHGNE